MQAATRLSHLPSTFPCARRATVAPRAAAPPPCLPLARRASSEYTSQQRPLKGPLLSRCAATLLAYSPLPLKSDEKRPPLAELPPSSLGAPSPICASRSSPSTLSPAETSSRSTTPEAGAGIAVSIFIAESTTSGSPSRIVSPGLTLTSTTTPGIGEPTEPGEPPAFSRAVALCTELSVTGTNQRSPLSSMMTCVWPFSSGLGTETSLTIHERPGSVANSTSSPTAIGWRKASVGSASTSPYTARCSCQSRKTCG
mmetsp:Transcript_1222/g.4302  ORF Transcript_1222/g.4302 Transcript_1222/m.4302 type:complete len:255 (+) Transcript_1222:82-846(+)